MALLMFSLARASASRSPRPHTDWSSRIAAGEAEREDGEHRTEGQERRKQKCVSGFVFGKMNFDVIQYSK